MQNLDDIKYKNLSTILFTYLLVNCMLLLGTADEQYSLVYY